MRKETGIMGFFDRIFGHKKVQTNTEKIPATSEQAASKNENVIKLLDLKNYIDSLMGAKKYIAKSDYFEKIKEYKPVIDFFSVLQSSGMLDGFARSMEFPYRKYRILQKHLLT